MKYEKNILIFADISEDFLYAVQVAVKLILK